jgi:hypothetical protein
MSDGGVVVVPPTPTEQIAEIIEKHGDWWGWTQEFELNARHCTCGMWMDSSPGAQSSRASHARHVTNLLWAALNLTEERHTYEHYDTEAVSGGNGLFTYAGQTSHYRGRRTLHRLVSGWVAVGEQP